MLPGVLRKDLYIYPEIKEDMIKESGHNNVCGGYMKYCGCYDMCGYKTMSDSTITNVNNCPMCTYCGYCDFQRPKDSRMNGGIEYFYSSVEDTSSEGFKGQNRNEEGDL